MRTPKLINFEKAFSDGAGSSYGTCACGKSYQCEDFMDHEAQEFKTSAKPITLPWSISWMSFEGSNYVPDCDCWVKRAEQVTRFLEAHGMKIASYFDLEKKRRLKEANDFPTIGSQGDERGG